ncbi:MAG TPA: hypothetical protein VF517_07890, partial [Thermoleophilaceae bacterium]
MPLLLLVIAAALAAAGCGGDDGGGPAAPAPTTSTQAEPAPAPTTGEAEPRESDEPKPRGERRERTPRSLAGCIKDAPGVEDALVKGRDSEDATFFADLVGGRVDVLGVTLSGESAEVGVFLFATPAAAAKAAPQAGGGGTVAR